MKQELKLVLFNRKGGLVSPEELQIDGDLIFPEDQWWCNTINFALYRMTFRKDWKDLLDCCFTLNISVSCRKDDFLSFRSKRDCADTFNKCLNHTAQFRDLFNIWIGKGYTFTFKDELPTLQPSINDIF